MDDKNAIDRLKEFIHYQKISIRKFFLECGLSEGSFTKTKSIGSENLKRIVHRYPEINLDWVVAGRGKMLMKDQFEHFFPPQTPVEGTDVEALKKENADLKEAIRHLQADLITCMKQKDAFSAPLKSIPKTKDPAK